MDPLEVILTECKDRMEMLSSALARGQCNSFEEYKYTCGQFRGLEATCAMIKDLQKNMESSDE